MSWKLLKTRTMPIGIDLGTAAVKLAQLRSTQGQLELVAAASAEVPVPCRNDLGKRLDFVSARLGEMMKRRPFRARKCIISIPAAATVVRHVKTAKVPPAQIDKALRWELEGKLPFDMSDAVVRHVVAGQTYNDQETHLEVIVMAASRQIIEAHLEAAHRCRLEVEALNVEPCAILECFARLFRRSNDNERVTLFLDLGQSCTQVVIGHGAKLVFARNLMIGAAHMDNAGSAALGVSVGELREMRRRLEDSPDPCPQADRIYDAMGEAMENIVAEITKCVQYYESVFPSSGIERAIFLGGQASDRRLCQRVAQRLNLPAQIGDPLARIAQSKVAVGRDGPDRRRAQPAWAVAVGLSLGADLPRAA